MSDLETFLTTGVFAFMLAFTRIGTAIMMMPGIGNSFVPANVRLYFALAFTLVFMPLIQAKLPPQMPGTGLLLLQLGFEFVVGLFIGVIARALMSALDVAGMVISTQSSLANAQLFNPAFASQGSVIGTFLTLSGVMLLFSSNLHHLMLAGLIDSYTLFPVGSVPDTGSMSQLLVEAVGGGFAIGVQISAPFLILVLLLYIGMGVMSKLMPQVQVFMIAIPIQIYLSLITFVLVVSVMMLVWLGAFEKGMSYFLTSPPQ